MRSDTKLFSKTMNHIALVHAMGVACLLASVFICMDAFAAASSPSAPEGDDVKWSLRLGAGAALTPEFEGSHQYKVQVLPIVEAELMDRIFLSSKNGLGVYVIKNNEWNTGIAAGMNLGRKENASDLLEGMGDIDPGVNMSAFVAWTPDPFTVRVTATQGFGDVEGFLMSAEASHMWSITPELHWENGVFTTFANETYNKTFFGVSSKQSRESERHYKKYDADAGFKDVGLNSSLSYMFTKEIAATLFSEYKVLTGPAADSPLVKAGSKNQFTTGLGLSYSFGSE